MSKDWAQRGWGRYLTKKEIREWRKAIREAREKKEQKPKWVNPWA